MVTSLKAESLESNAEQLHALSLLSKEERIDHAAILLESMGFIVEDSNATVDKHSRKIKIIMLPNRQRLGKLCFDYTGKRMLAWFLYQGNKNDSSLPTLLVKHIIRRWHNKSLFVEYVHSHYTSNMPSGNYNGSRSYAPYNAENELFILRDMFQEYVEQVRQMTEETREVLSVEQFTGKVLPFFMAGDKTEIASVSLTQGLEPDSQLVSAFRYDLAGYAPLQSMPPLPDEWLTSVVSLTSHVADDLRDIFYKYYYERENQYQNSNRSNGNFVFITK